MPFPKTRQTSLTAWGRSRWLLAVVLLGAAGSLFGPRAAWAAEPARVWETPPLGDSTRGRALYQSQCTACHAIEVHRVGPAHRGVLGRRVGGAAGYTYSAELAASRLRWTAQTLNAWLAEPEGLVPGQRMGYQVEDAQARADLIAFLATLK